jgi:hypothetical protein
MGKHGTRRDEAVWACRLECRPVRAEAPWEPRRGLSRPKRGWHGADTEPREFGVKALTVDILPHAALRVHQPRRRFGEQRGGLGSQGGRWR